MKNINEQLRGLYSLKGAYPTFDTSKLPTEPEDLFIQWLHLAIKRQISEPHAMTLSTVDADGAPDARVLILKHVANNRWFFASSTESKKGQQLQARPNVALTFYWSLLGRQVRIRGMAHEMGIEASTQDFLNRSEMARAIALIGKQSETLASDHDLTAALAEKRALLKRQPQTVYPRWKLYAVDADEVEFWQGSLERMNIRIKYMRRDEQWEHIALWP